MRTQTIIYWAAAVAVCFWEGTLTAQPLAPLAIRAQAKPSFLISPLVQRFSGRRGQRIKFQFEVQNHEVPQSLQIRAVKLKQQLNGLITADGDAPPPEMLQLLGPLKCDLKVGEKTVIQGHIDVPTNPAPFHSLGILVTDLGRPLQAPANDSSTSVGIQFVTQYLLRIEVQVQNVRQENAKKLQIQSASLVEREGLPFVDVVVVNPSDTAVEFRLNARLLQKDGRQFVPSFGMVVPARANRKEPECYNSLVFGESRVLLTAPVPEAVFPGRYQIEVECISDRRKVGQVITPILVREDDFPAQAARSVQISEAVNVTPSQIELSMRRGGSRRVPLQFVNKGQQSLPIRVSLLNMDGTPADWALSMPAEFTLPGGSSRNVLVMARSGQDIETHRYGVLRIEAGSGASATEIQDLSVALIARAEGSPRLTTGSLRWEADGRRPAFVVPIANQGTIHAPLKGRITLQDVVGQKIEIPGGFDRWLLPGCAGEIRFPLHRALPPGQYDVRMQIETTDNQELLIIDQQVKITEAKSDGGDSARKD